MSLQEEPGTKAVEPFFAAIKEDEIIKDNSSPWTSVKRTTVSIQTISFLSDYVLTAGHFY